MSQIATPEDNCDAAALNSEQRLPDQVIELLVGGVLNITITSSHIPNILNEEESLKQLIVQQNEGKSDYFKKLCISDIRRRYLDKISLIEDIDPFTLTKKNQFFIQNDMVPRINFADIVAYFVFSHSYYSGEQIKSYKSLQAYKYVKSEFIRDFSAYKIQDHYVFVAQVGSALNIQISKCKMKIILYRSCIL